MANSYFTIPDTGTIIYNGDTVILAEYPGVMAVAAYGWYKSGQSSEMGWHFVLLPTNEAISVADVNLSLVTVVSNASGNHRPDCRPCPPSPGPSQMEQRTFITLDSMAQLKNMKTMFMPNGRIVRVNNKGDGKPGYYEWNVVSQEWDIWDISQVSPGPTPIPEGVIQLQQLGIITSVSLAKFADPYIRYSFKAGQPLCNDLSISENSACVLYYTDTYQVIYVVSSQDSFIRQVYQISPEFLASEWSKSRSQSRLELVESAVTSLGTRTDALEISVASDKDRISVLEAEMEDKQTRLSAVEEQVLVWKENERLENALSGLPDRTYDELNAMLEARLNGDSV